MTDYDMIYGTPSIYLAMVMLAYEAGDQELLRTLAAQHQAYHAIRRLNATCARHVRELEAL